MIDLPILKSESRNKATKKNVSSRINKASTVSGYNITESPCLIRLTLDATHPPLGELIWQMLQNVNFEHLHVPKSVQNASKCFTCPQIYWVQNASNMLFQVVQHGVRLSPKILNQKASASQVLLGDGKALPNINWSIENPFFLRAVSP